MAMISKSAKQPMEGISSAAAPSAKAAGAAGSGKAVKYVTDMQATKVMGNFRTGDNKPGARGAISKGVSVASEDVTKGMGGKVIKDMQ
jgi:hypothetical protein